MDAYELVAERLNAYKIVALYARAYKQAVEAEDIDLEIAMGRELDTALALAHRWDNRIHVEASAR